MTQRLFTPLGRWLGRHPLRSWTLAGVIAALVLAGAWVPMSRTTGHQAHLVTVAAPAAADKAAPQATGPAAPDACSLTQQAITIAAHNQGTVALADLVGTDATVRTAVASWNPAAIQVGQPTGAADPAVSVGPAGPDPTVAEALQNCPAGASVHTVSVPFFVKALAASAAQIATWLVIASGCEAAFPAAAAICKKVADFCGGFVGALVFQAFDGKINRTVVVNSFLNGLTTIALGTAMRRGNLVEELASQFRRAGAWLRDGFLNRLSHAVGMEFELTITSL